MNKILFGLIAGLALVITGCSTTGTAPSFNSQTAANAIHIAAEDGTVATLLYSPQYRSGFVAATNILSSVQATNLTDLTGILQNINVGGKSAPYVLLGLDNVMTILNSSGVNLQSLPFTNQLAVVQVWQGALLNGVSKGLAFSAPQ